MKHLSKILLLVLFVNLLSVSLALPALAYSVDISSYDAFRGATYGNAYDIDGSYGAQCWDGAALLWQQLGRWLDTGDGRARGTWLNCRDSNAGSDFDLIYGIENVRRGDVVVFDYNANFNAVDDYGTPFGHIAFADNDYTPGVGFNVYGQNQLGVGAFSVQYDVHTDGFLGAFRLKRWSSQPVMGTLDINGILDGVRSGTLGGYGTCDVYIDDVLVANDVSDFYQAYPVKTKYLVTDIKPNDGYAYEGWDSNGSGELLGGIIGRKGIALNLKFSTQSLPKTFKATILSLDGRCVARGGSNLSYDNQFSVYLVDKGSGRSIYHDWIFRRLDDGSYNIVQATNSSYAWDPLLQTGIDNDIKVYDIDKGSTSHVKWFVKEYNGYYYIESAQMGYCLTAESQGDPSYNDVLKGRAFARSSSQLFDLEMHNNDVVPTDFSVMPQKLYLQAGERKKLSAVILPYDATEELKGYTLSVPSFRWIPVNGIAIDADGYVTAKKPGVYPVSISPTARYYENLKGTYVIVPSLSAPLKRIEEEAYANTDIEIAVIPEGCTYIGRRAFADCANLMAVYIPKSVKEIGEDAFAGDKNNFMHFFGYKGSVAESHVKESGYGYLYNFINISE